MAVDVGFILLLPLPPSPFTAPARSKLQLSTDTRPSPLQRDVGRFDPARPGDMKGGIQGRTQEVGEAQQVRHENGPRLSLWPIFGIHSHSSPTDYLGSPTPTSDTT